MKSWKFTLPPFRKYKIDVFTKAYKAGQFVYQIGESPILREPTKPVSISELKTSKFQSKLNYLKACLLKYRKLTSHGRGMAAPQVGIHEKFAIIYTPKKLITIINPKITKKSEKLLKYPEMCMSAYPIVVPLKRPSWIEFEYLDESGKAKIWDTKDITKLGTILNRVFQHEIDHLNGILNIDIGNPREFILESDPNFYRQAKFETV